jgi:chromosomal replication initiation ATPase DnaA
MINQQFKPEIFVGMNIAKGISLDSILQAACRLTGVTKEQALSKSRFNKLPYARQLYCYVAYSCNQRLGTERQAHRKSLHEIGAVINCDHSTVIASKNKIQNQLGIYEDVTKDVQAVKDAIMIPNSVFNTEGIDSNNVGHYITDMRRQELKEWCDKNDVVSVNKFV